MLEGVIPLETFPLCGVALRRTYRCTEFHRVKNANLRHPFRNVLRKTGPTKGCRANDDNDDTDVSKGHSRVCTGVLKCLIFLKKKKTGNNSKRCALRMLCGSEETFAPYCTCYHTFSLQNPAVY